jgi:hypothetical protein
VPIEVPLRLEAFPADDALEAVRGAAADPEERFEPLRRISEFLKFGIPECAALSILARGSGARA